MSAPDETPTPEQQKALAIADGLRALADMIADNPTTVPSLSYPFSYGGVINCPVGGKEDARTRIELVVAAARRAGAKLSERSSGDSAGVEVRFGPVALYVYTDRAWLADQPQPAPPPYRPLLDPEPEDGTS